HGIADIHRSMLLAHCQAKDSLNQIRNVAEASCLASVAENRERLIIQSLADKRRNHAAISQTHSRSVCIEDADNLRVHSVKTVVSHRHRLGKSLCFVVDPTRSDWIHITPVVLVLWVY